MTKRRPKTLTKDELLAKLATVPSASLKSTIAMVARDSRRLRKELEALSKRVQAEAEELHMLFLAIEQARRDGLLDQGSIEGVEDALSDLRSDMVWAHELFESAYLPLYDLHQKEHGMLAGFREMVGIYKRELKELNAGKSRKRP